MSEDWLDTTERPGLPAVVELPTEYAARAKLAQDAWDKLTPRQKTFLSAWRDCRYNASAAARQLGLSSKTKPHTTWMENPDYALVVRIWRANAAANALDRERLLARQDDIVETLLTPKPVLHQGIMVRDTRDPTGTAILEEVEAGAAAKANETLMKAAGLLKDKDVEVNVAVAVGPPQLNIVVVPLPQAEVKKDTGVVIDAQYTEVPRDEWLET